MISLKDKVAIVTGASRGIGKATALTFAQAGCHVIVHFAQREDAAAQVAKHASQFGVAAKTFRADIADRKQVAGMIDFTIKEFGKIDILVNNAGIWKEAAIDMMTEEQLGEMMEINVNGVFHAITATVPQMKKQRTGNIINISSTAGQRGEAFHSHYAASKGAIISLTKSLAPELAPYNIRVNCVAPGWIDTDMSHDALQSDERDKILATIPLGRVGTPDELAGAVFFLASDLATFITGEVLNINGGAVLCG